jgi:hypothetical protein
MLWKHETNSIIRLYKDVNIRKYESYSRLVAYLDL